MFKTEQLLLEYKQLVFELFYSFFFKSQLFLIFSA
jgi:hypothetical protein